MTFRCALSWVACVCAFIALASCATVPKPVDMEGTASWYGRQHQGRKTANGERFNMHALTAAHRTLPFGTMVRVTSLTTHKDVVVRINDRGPYAKDRVIDLSYEAAREIGMLDRGYDQVVIKQLH